MWGAWHIPYYLYFLDRAVLQQVTDLPLAAFIVAAIGVMIAWAIAYGELFLLTRSIWPAVLMQSVEDAFVNPLFTEGRIVVDEGGLARLACERSDQRGVVRSPRRRPESSSENALTEDPPRRPPQAEDEGVVHRRSRSHSTEEYSDHRLLRS